MEVLFPNISRVFLEYFQTTKNTCMPWRWTKLWKLDFPIFFFFYNISKIFKGNKRGKCHNRQRKAEFKGVQRKATTKSSKREKGERRKMKGTNE